MGNKIKNQVAIKRIFTVYFGTIIAKIIPMATDKIFAINDVLVRDEIVEIPFSCDLNKCKGACCTLESELGAPVNKAEIDEIRKILPIIKKYLTQVNIDEIEEYGFYEIKDGEMMITSVNNHDCVF